jgi:cystathionine gamma-lyase
MASLTEAQATTKTQPAPEQRGDRAGTRFVHAGFHHDAETGAVVPPIHFATTFAQEEPGKHKGYEYSRSGNPTRRVIAIIERGTRGFAFASGLAATDTLLRLVGPEEEVVASRNLYGGTFRLFNQVLARYGTRFHYVDTREPDNVQARLSPQTRMVFLETPTNPNLELVDIKTTVDIVRAYESEQGNRILVVVDNTFATPYNQTPLTQGADVALHSVTKYLGGHSDVLGGALAVSGADLAERIWFHQNAIGGVMDPFSAYMTHRGLKTLHVRMARHAENAQAIAEWLAGHDQVKTVWYPGLKDHPQHGLSQRQMRTPGGMVSFELNGGMDAGRKFMRQVRVWTVAESLGAVESLINHPVSMTHGSIPKAEREAAGITDGLIRLSVGLEDKEDLIADLESAFRHL